MKTFIATSAVAALNMQELTEMAIEKIKNAESPFLGSHGTNKHCGNVNVQPDFTLESYLGTWYELYRDIPDWWYNGECVMTRYSLKATDKINVANTVQDRNPDGSFKDRSHPGVGTATYADLNNKDAHLKVRFTWLQPWGTYNVLATDYETYSVVYECDNFLFDTFNLENLWVLTRQPLDHSNPEDHVEIERISKEVKKALAGNGI